MFTDISTDNLITDVWDRMTKCLIETLALLSNDLIGRMELLSPTPRILPMNIGKHLQITPPQPITTQNVKEQNERVRTDFTSHNTVAYNKPFRLRDLRWLIMKAILHAPGPDGIHSNLLKHFPEDTLKSSNKSWITSGCLVISLPKLRAATVTPISKTNKDHT